MTDGAIFTLMIVLVFVVIPIIILLIRRWCDGETNPTAVNPICTNDNQQVKEDIAKVRFYRELDFWKDYNKE